jgi:hypothetical protein
MNVLIARCVHGMALLKSEFCSMHTYNIGRIRLGFISVNSRVYATVSKYFFDNHVGCRFNPVH